MPRRPESSPDPVPPSGGEPKKDTRRKTPGLGFGLSNPQTANVEYDKDELEFIKAIELYKRTQRRNFPTWREVLYVLKSLGYVKPHVPRDFLAADGLSADNFEEE